MAASRLFPAVLASLLLALALAPLQVPAGASPGGGAGYIVIIGGSSWDQLDDVEIQAGGGAVAAGRVCGDAAIFKVGPEGLEWALVWGYYQPGAESYVMENLSEAFSLHCEGSQAVVAGSYMDTPMLALAPCGQGGEVRVYTLQSATPKMRVKGALTALEPLGGGEYLAAGRVTVLKRDVLGEWRRVLTTLVLAKVRVSGSSVELEWIHFYRVAGGSGMGGRPVVAALASSGGHVYLSVSGIDAFLAAVSDSGEPEWAYRIYAAGRRGYVEEDSVTGIVPRGDGAIVAGYTYTLDVYKSNGFIAAVRGDGALEWVRVVNFRGGGLYSITRVSALVPHGDNVVAVIYRETEGNWHPNRVFLVELTPGGGFAGASMIRPWRPASQTLEPTAADLSGGVIAVGGGYYTLRLLASPEGVAVAYIPYPVEANETYTFTGHTGKPGRIMVRPLQPDEARMVEEALNANTSLVAFENTTIEEVDPGVNVTLGGVEPRAVATSLCNAEIHVAKPQQATATTTTTTTGATTTTTTQGATGTATHAASATTPAPGATGTPTATTPAHAGSKAKLAAAAAVVVIVAAVAAALLLRR